MRELFSRNHARRAVLAVGLGLLCGCSKAEPKAGPPVERNVAKVSIESQSQAEAPPAAPVTPAATPAASSGSEASADAPPADRGAATPGEQELLDGVYKAYRNFYADKLRYARDLDELIKGGYLKKAPVAPPGKKIVLDAKSFNVYLAPQ